MAVKMILAGDEGGKVEGNVRPKVRERSAGCRRK
jgi:hypothetical protein